MRYFNCRAVEVGSSVGIDIVAGGMFGVGSGAAVSGAGGVRVVRGGGVSGSPIVDGAADDGAPQALSNTSATSRILASVLMRGIILHRIFAATQASCRCGC